jgi:hypothetical protein
LDGFRPLLTSIYHANGGEIQYSGIATNPDGIKSAAGFDIFASEESQFYSQKSLDILTPTARNAAKAGLPTKFDPAKQEAEEKEDIPSNAQMFFIGNPASSADPFSKRFIVPFKSELDRNGIYEDDMHLIIKMNYDDNPWFHDSGLEADRLFCYVDLGPITEDLRLSVYERLLTLNLLSGTKTSGVYTIDPASGNAIFCVHLMHPERLDGTELAGLLQTYIHQALELHRTLLHNTDTASIFDIANQVFGNDRTSNLAELA